MSTETPTPHSVIIATESVELVKMICGDCGIVFAVPSFWVSDKRFTNGQFFCPNGCKRTFQLSPYEQLSRAIEQQGRESGMLIEQKSAEVEALRDKVLHLGVENRKLARRKSEVQIVGEFVRRFSMGLCPVCGIKPRNMKRHMIKHS